MVYIIWHARLKLRQRHVNVIQPENACCCWYEMSLSCFDACIWLFVHSLSNSCEPNPPQKKTQTGLQIAGGIRPFGKYLAEDFFISEVCTENEGYWCAMNWNVTVVLPCMYGEWCFNQAVFLRIARRFLYVGCWNITDQALFTHGFRPRMALYPARQQFQSRPFMTVYTRHLRWMRLRRSMMFYSTLAEPLLECLVIGPIGFLSTRSFYSDYDVPWFLFVGIHATLWFLSDTLLLKLLHVSCVSVFVCLVCVFIKSIGCLYWDIFLGCFVQWTHFDLLTPRLSTTFLILYTMGWWFCQKKIAHRSSSILVINNSSMVHARGNNTDQ